MIILISSLEKSFRKNKIEEIIKSTPDSEVIFFDDTYGTATDLEQYMFPSLFTISMPIVHSKFLANDNPALFTTTFIKKLMSSPTTFLFEEFEVPSTLVNNIKKSGAVVHVDEKKAEKKESNIFSVTNIITNKDKKSRWLAYQKAIGEYEIESIIGILYWKLKDSIIKSRKADEKKYFQNLYTKFLHAHKDAWQRGTPLDLSIEKVILEN